MSTSCENTKSSHPSSDFEETFHFGFIWFGESSDYQFRLLIYSSSVKNIFHVLKITCGWLLPSKGSCTHAAKSQTLTVGACGRVRVYSAGRQARRTGNSCSKHQNILMNFGQGFLKTMWGGRVVGYVISLWTFFWLTGGEVIGWCFGNLSLLVPASLRSVSLWSACSHHPLPGGGGMVWGLSFCRTT